MLWLKFIAPCATARSIRFGRVSGTAGAVASGSALPMQTKASARDAVAIHSSKGRDFTMSVQCIRCGDEPRDLLSLLFSLNAPTFYACRAPLCAVRGVCFCSACLTQMGARQDWGGGIAACPTCKVGKMRYLP